MMRQVGLSGGGARTSSLEEEASDCSSTAPNLLPLITTLPVLIAWALTPYLAFILPMKPVAAGSGASSVFTSFVNSWCAAWS